MAQNKNKIKLKQGVDQDDALLKKLPGLLALCEFALLPFFVVSPVFSTEQSAGVASESSHHTHAVASESPGSAEDPRSGRDSHQVERSLSAATPSEVQIAAAPEPILEPKEIIEVTVTAYSSTVDQTDSTPFHTANGKDVEDGIVAANFLPLGTQLRIPEVFGNQIFTVEDRMHERFDRHLDIWMSSREDAQAFGIRYLTVEIL